MAKFTILCLAGLAVCQAGLIPSHLRYDEYPNLNAVHHGHGATSYQNVQMQNYGSVPIPKDLQVDDGNEHLHSHYGGEIVEDERAIQRFEEELHAPQIEHVVVSTEASYALEEEAQDAQFEPHRHYAPSNYEDYDHEAEYEYR